jgi:hypothetical protein
VKFEEVKHAEAMAELLHYENKLKRESWIAATSSSWRPSSPKCSASAP